MTYTPKQALLDRVLGRTLAIGQENKRREESRQRVLDKIGADTPEDAMLKLKDRSDGAYKMVTDDINKLQAEVDRQTKRRLIELGIDKRSAEQAVSAGKLKGDELAVAREKMMALTGDITVKDTDNLKPNSSFKGKKNAYSCEEFGHIFITIDTDEGTTPFMTLCQADGCSAWAKSAFYRVNQDYVPTHEWYRPDDVSGETEATKAHVEKGGLLLREIEGA